MNIYQYINDPTYAIKEAETIVNLVFNTIHANIEMPYHIILSNEPIDNTFDINIHSRYHISH